MYYAYFVMENGLNISELLIQLLLKLGTWTVAMWNWGEGKYGDVPPRSVRFLVWITPILYWSFYSWCWNESGFLVLRSREDDDFNYWNSRIEWVNKWMWDASHEKSSKRNEFCQKMKAMSSPGQSTSTWKYPITFWYFRFWLSGRLEFLMARRLFWTFSPRWEEVGKVLNSGCVWSCLFRSWKWYTV